MLMLRHVILSLSLACTSFLLANTLLFHFTVICIKPENRSNETLFTPTEESWIFSSLSIGRLLGIFPIIKMIEKHGLKLTFTMFGLISGLATLIAPFGYDNVAFMVILRFLQGFGVPTVFAALGSIPHTWSRNDEKSSFIAVLSSCYQVAPVLAMTLAALFCSNSCDWPTVYYLFGSLTIMSFIAFYAVFSDDPLSNRFIPDKVKQQSERHQKSHSNRAEVPYRAIFTSLSVWGLWIAAFGDALGHQMFLMYGPTYMNKVLDFNVASTGFLAALPFLLCIGAKNIGGMLLDRIRCVADHPKIMVFTTVAQAGMTICFLLLTLLSAGHPILAELIFTFVVLFSGLHNVGLFSACQTVAKKHSHVLTMIVSMEIGLVAIILPLLVSTLAPENEKIGWKTIFYIIAGGLLVSNIGFWLLTRVRTAIWAEKQQEQANTDARTTQL